MLQKLELSTCCNKFYSLFQGHRAKSGRIIRRFKVDSNTQQMASNGEGWAFHFDGQENLNWLSTSVSMIQPSFHSSFRCDILARMVQQRGEVEYNWQVLTGLEDVNNVACTVALGPLSFRFSEGEV